MTTLTHHQPTPYSETPMTTPTHREEPPHGDDAELNAALDVATLREDATTDRAVTVLESGSRAHGPAPPGSALLPDALAADYCLLRHLSGGGEAALFEVIEAATGETRVLKLYHRHVTLRGEALRRIQAIDSFHVVRLTDFGQLADGRWYEVQERIAAGNLVDYRSSEHFAIDGIGDVVAQLAGAISAFHAAGLAHHDIKPENLLVRHASPLDLVLGDFGLSVVSNNSTYYATNRNATIAYQAPETMRQVGGETRDYWALGLTIAMLATGDAPYQGLSEHAILDEHYKQTPPSVIESMPPGRLKQLCRGLTRYNPKTRWSEREVRVWLEGQDPPVAPERPRRKAATTAVRFNNKRFMGPAGLAREIVGCWSLAAECIGVRSRRDRFMDEIILAFGTEPLARLTERWSAEPPPRNGIDAAVVELALALDAETPAIFAGRILNADSIAAAALGDSEPDIQFVQDLRTRAVLEAWAGCPDNAELGAIDRRWREELCRADGIISDVAAAGADAPPIEAWAGPLLAVCARGELLEDWKQQQRSSRPRGDLVPSWYPQVAGGSTPAEVIGSVLLSTEAERVQRNDLEARCRERGEARREQRVRRFRILRAVAGWLTAAAFVGGAALELQGVHLIGHPMVWRGNLALLALAFALFRQWRHAESDCRRAEAYGIAAAVSVIYWVDAGGPPISPVHLLGGDWSDPLMISQEAFKLAGLLSISWSLLSVLHRWTEGPPSSDEVHQLREADRRTLKRTGWLTMTGVVPAMLGSILIVTSLGDDLGVIEFGRLFIVSGLEMVVVVVMRGLWVPLLASGLSLLVRGRWACRPAGTTWGVALLVASVMASSAGQHMIHNLIDVA